MGQTKRHSLIESLSNVAIGYFVALASQLKWLIEWMDCQPESRAVLIEEAICKRHKLKPPKDGEV